jgi:bacterioferritin (cytochrome b1)
VAEKTDPMDVPAVLECLNRVLRLQSRSVLQFTLVAGGGRGPHALALGELLTRYAHDELTDTRTVVSKIVSLGGEPDPRVEPLAYHGDIGDALGYLIDTERETIAALHEVIPHSGQEPRSEALEHLMEHLIMRKQAQVDALERARPQ